MKWRKGHTGKQLQLQKRIITVRKPENDSRSQKFFLLLFQTIQTERAIQFVCLLPPNKTILLLSIWSYCYTILKLSS